MTCYTYTKHVVWWHNYIGECYNIGVAAFTFKHLATLTVISHLPFSEVSLSAGGCGEAWYRCCERENGVSCVSRENVQL